MDCRRIETNQALESLRKYRFTWIVSEWDMGGDDFLAVLKQYDKSSETPVYRIDMRGFEGLDDINSLRIICPDGDINKLLECLEACGPAYVLLDNVEVGQSKNESEVINGTLTLVESIKDFSPEIKIIARSGRAFNSTQFKPTILRSLDQAECKVYVDVHPDGKNAGEDNVSLGDVYDFTQGFPRSIDRLLKQLAYSSFSEIANGSSDQSIDDNADVSPETKAIIENLSTKALQGSRLYDLLLALSVFQFGETIETIKYYNREKPFRIAMLTELIELGLAEVSETSELGMKRGEIKQFVAVKRPIQAYLHKLIGEEELKTYYEKAIAAYFGKEYRLRKYKLTTSLKLKDHNLSSLAEQNASLILNRFIMDGIEHPEATSKDILERIQVFHYYADKLHNFNKYLYLVRVCKALLPNLDDYSDNNYHKSIQQKYASSLRMLGRHDESISEFNKLLIEQNDSDTLAAVHVSLGYSYLALEDFSNAIDAANKVKEFKPKGTLSYHAQSVIILASPDEKKYGSLKRLAKKARNDECFVSANNMAFDLIDQHPDEAQKFDLYRKLWKQAKQDRDSYNMLKAVANCCSLAMKLGEDISPDEANLLLEAYRFSCSQRQAGMFAKSHNALWEFFEKHSSIDNLLILFRHSSILQRLTGRDSNEKNYLMRLVETISKSKTDLSGLNENIKRYFVARALSHNAMSLQKINKLISH